MDHAVNVYKMAIVDRVGGGGRTKNRSEVSPSWDHFYKSKFRNLSFNLATLEEFAVLLQSK